MEATKARSTSWVTRYVALSRREKLLVVGAVLLAILLGGHTLWIEPAGLQRAHLQQSLARQQDDLTQLRAHLVALAQQAGDPDAAGRAALTQLRQEIAVTERGIGDFGRMLVPPSQATALLQALLARHRGLSLVSLVTLPPRPLLAAPTKQGDKEAPLVSGGNIYQHGVEIKVAGSYHDLQRYVDALEKGEQKLFWGALKLTVQKYPISELTLTIYTLSLEPAWLVV